MNHDATWKIYSMIGFYLMTALVTGAPSLNLVDARGASDAAGASEVEDSVLAPDKPAKINAMTKLYHDYGQFNGVILVAENGQIIYKTGIGLANMEWGIPNQPDTKFRIASITKQFTAALILQLVEENKVKLDGKIIDYLPDYRHDTGGKVTLHHLLNHTSGIPSYTNLPRFFQHESRTRYSVDEFVKKFASGDLEFEPGSQFAYSNSGYYLLGVIIETLTGKFYEEAMKKRIFDPLGMKNSGYDWHATILQNRAAGYQKTLDGFVNAPYYDMSLPYASGALYSTVEDLYLWDQALYTDKVLSSTSKELMFKPGLSDYGYGFFIRKVPIGRLQGNVKMVQHAGGINGFNTLIVRLVDTQHLIVLLDNTSQGRYHRQITHSVINILYDQPYEAPKKSIAEALYPFFAQKGVEAAIASYRTLKVSDADTYDFSTDELNLLGYQLLGTNKIKDAIKIFKLNIEVYPKNSNPYDSLGEAYLADGNEALALQYYQKTLELNPDNPNAVAVVRQLEGSEGKVDSSVLDQ